MRPPSTLRVHAFAALVVSIVLSSCALTPGLPATPAAAPGFRPLQVDVAAASRWKLSTEAQFEGHTWQDIGKRSSNYVFPQSA